MSHSLLHDPAPVLPMANRQDMTQALKAAMGRGSGMAAGKLGLSEQAMLLYPTLLDRCPTERQQQALTLQTRQHCAVQMGIFPNDREGMLAYGELHARASRELDFVGLVGGRLEADLLRELQPMGQTISLYDLEPDRSIPDQSNNCYLPTLSDKRVLLVSSIAEFLCTRASAQIFEAVWAKTGKPWFAPAQVLPLQFPYTYALDTQSRFVSSQHLLHWILERINPADFDVALIAGSSLGIPIAAAIKTMDRSAIALGGALQVLFGVGGKRWWSDANWQRDYITPAWVRVPADLVPKVAGPYVDDGAYW
jgi:hypothetical protein